MNAKNLSRMLIFLLISLSLTFPSLSIVPVKIVKELHIQVKVDILLLGNGGTEKLAELSADIPAGKKGFLAKVLKLKGGQNEEEVSMEIEIFADTKQNEIIVLEIDSTTTPVESPKKMELKRHERLEINQGSSSLLEIYKSSKTEKKIILSLSGSIDEVETFRPSYPSTTKVRFQLNIYRISGGKDILLEQNALNTFIGQTASYYLHLYTGEKEKEKKKGKLDEDELDIRMTPLSIADETAEVEIAVVGRILKANGNENPVDFKRVEKIANSSSHEVIIASEESDGTLQEGYKFEIIPSF